MKAGALVMEKLSSTSPSLFLSPCLPLCLYKVCRWWVSENAQYCPISTPTSCPHSVLGSPTGTPKHIEHPMGLESAFAGLPHDSNLPAGKR